MLKDLGIALSFLMVLVWLMGCASTPEPVVADRGSRIDYVAIYSAINQTPEGRVNKEEFCSYFKDKDLGARTFEALDKKKKGYLTKEDVEKNQAILDQVIRLTTPSFTR
jgi:hypothetical protein